MRRVAALLAIGALLVTPLAALAAEELHADVTAEAEVPAPTLPEGYEGSGSATVVISDDESEIEYEVTFQNLTGPLTMAHIHWGAEGEAGPPIFWLTEMGVDDTPSPLTGTLSESDFIAADGGPQSYDEALEAMRSGDTYVNLHTEMNPPGEIRGQLVLEDAEPVLPDTSTEQITPAANAGMLAAGLLILAGLAALFVGLRRFSAIRA